MRKLIFVSTSLFLMSCTESEIYQPTQPKNQICGNITAMESSPNNGEFIYVKMNSYETYKYQIQGVIDDYYLGQEICNFAGMQKVQY